MVSAGGPNHELSSLNLDTGVVETLFRCSNPESDRKLQSSDLPTVPTYVRETNFKDNRFVTQRRESNIKSFNKHLKAV